MQVDVLLTILILHNFRFIYWMRCFQNACHQESLKKYFSSILRMTVEADIGNKVAKRLGSSREVYSVTGITRSNEENTQINKYSKTP